MKFSINITVLCMLLTVTSVIAKPKKQRELVDPLLQAQCDLSCWDVPKTNRTECRSDCKKNIIKSGSCPSDSGTALNQACVDSCTMDAHCAGMFKCCKHSCGQTCREPQDLLTVPGLPSIPSINTVQERKESTRIKWSDQVGDPARRVPGRVLYILEVQQHLGPKYEEARMSEWKTLQRTSKTQATLKKTLQPGRWFRFRVASVNTQGSRGFSSPSEPFTLRLGPRAPAPPKRLRITKLQNKNGNITAVLRWRAPQSDLPIIRYKIYWSRRVQGIDTELDSVFVNQKSVPKNQNKLEISDLESNSLYFLQVQAISQFGDTKLRSEKSAVFLNTTDYDNETAKLPKNQNSKSKISNFKLLKVIWHKNKLKARVTWSPTEKDDEPQRYLIQWRSNTCNGTNNESDTKKQLAATTSEEVFELYELNYGCKYTVHLNQMPAKNRAPPDATLNFEMPSCSQFKHRIKNNNITCT